MNVLLDTHVVLWALEGNAALGSVEDLILDGRTQVAVSAASVWEIAIKSRLGKLRVPDDLLPQLERARFTPLPVTWAHAHAVRYLPPHHADPFDRLLVAQSQLERLTIVTKDPAIGRYDVDTVLI